MAATPEQMTAEITRMSEQIRALAAALDETRRGAAQSHEIIRRLQAEQRQGGDRGDRMINAKTIEPEYFSDMASRGKGLSFRDWAYGVKEYEPQPEGGNGPGGARHNSPS